MSTVPRPHVPPDYGKHDEALREHLGEAVRHLAAAAHHCDNAAAEAAVSPGRELWPAKIEESGALLRRAHELIDPLRERAEVT